MPVLIGALRINILMGISVALKENFTASLGLSGFKSMFRSRNKRNINKSSAFKYYSHNCLSRSSDDNGLIFEILTRNLSESQQLKTSSGT